MTTPNLYQLEAITKSHRVGEVFTPALGGVSLQVERGEFIALTGPSGSGKSTLLNILGLMERPSTGIIRFCGHDLSRCTDYQQTDARRRAIGFIFQNFNLVPILTARENVEYALYLEGTQSGSEVRRRAERVLGQLGIASLGGHRPAQLSGGQRQRVAIARAVVKDPKVILADEPTANLDSQNAEQILKILRELNRSFGTTVVIATHDQKLAALADRRIHLCDGKLQRDERAAGAAPAQAILAA